MPLIRLVVPVFSVLAVGLAGCSADSAAAPGSATAATTSTPPPSASTASAVPSPSSPPSASSPAAGAQAGAAAGSAAPARTAIRTVTSASPTDVATGLATPWGLARLPDGSHLVSLRDQARVLRVDSRGRVTRVPGTGSNGRVAGVRPGGEGGLLGLAVRPGDSRTVYAYLTSATDNRVVRMSYQGGRLGAPVRVVTGIPKASFHNGGRIAFGPDGMLYIATGDAGRTGSAQDRGSLGGKILRVTPTGAAARGNPFRGSRVWSLGHRNVQGIGWDRSGRMFASEFGQNTWDELNRILPGRNYGWPRVEGMGTASDVRRGYTRPLRVWRPSQASPSGLAVSGDAIYLAALRGQRLWRVPLAANGATGTPQSLLQGRLGRLRAVEVQRDGSLLVLTDNAGRSFARRGDDRLVRVRLRG